MRTASKNFPNITTVFDPDTNETFDIQNDAFTVGAGYLNVAAALQDASTSTGATAESPSVEVDEQTGQVLLVSGETAIWGRNGLFDTTAIWGRAVLEGSTAIWGRSDYDEQVQSLSDVFLFGES